MERTRRAIAGIVALFLAGCSVIELERQAEQLTKIPVVYGTVTPENWGGEPLVLILSRDAGPGGVHDVEYLVHHEPGPFYFYVDPGTYRLAAFEDRSGKMQYRPGDPVLVRTAPIVATGEREDVEADLEGRLKTETLPPRFEIDPASTHTQISLAHRNLGRVVTMDAREMSLELGQVGMWEPAKYMKEQQVGIFFLEPFDEKKIPVLFVHGIGGAPIQFEQLASGLDRDRFQPWFFAYPSIFPLHMIAEALKASLDILRRQHEFDELFIVAHSMGGLVTRGYLNEYQWSRHDYDVKLFVSMASPFGGESGAEYYPGEDHAEKDADGPFSMWITKTRTPEGEPSHIAWTDMAPDSQYLTTLYDEPLPEETSYVLVFAYDPSNTLGAATDGTVTLESQLRPQAQREATSERGFLMLHDDVLVEPAPVAYILSWIRDAARPQ